MKFFLFLFSFFLLFSNDSVEQASLLHGRLENGLTYYIHKNQDVINKCSLSMIVQTGSLNEREDEKGVAHFLEHMLFRGTTHFKDGYKTLFSPLKGGSSAFSFNAFTSYKTTEYFFDHVATDENVYDTMFSLLNEMMFEATIDPELLEKERGIVLSEKATIDPKEKAFISQYQDFLQMKDFSDNHPIGNEDVICSVSAEKMKDFYKREYRPDKMALVISSNVEPSILLEKIQKVFKHRISGENDARQTTSVIQREEPEVFVQKDRGAGVDRISFSCVKNALRDEVHSESRSKKIMMRKFIQLYLNEKMSREAIDSGCYFKPFVGSYLYNDDFMIDELSLEFCKGKEIQSVERFFSDYVQVLATPMDAAFFDYCKNELCQSLDNLLNQKGALSCRQWVEHLRDDFLLHYGLINLFDMIKDQKNCIDLLDKSEIDEYMLTLLNKLRRFCSITYRTTCKTVCNTSDLLEAFEKGVEYGQQAFSQGLNGTRVKIKDLKVQTSWFKSANWSLFQQGIIYWNKLNSGIYYTRLDNGMLILLNPRKNDQDTIDVVLRAKGGVDCWAPQGDSLESHQTSYLLQDTINHSGIANLKGQELDNYLYRHGIDFSFTLSTQSRFINMTVANKSLKQMFKILNASFEERRLEKNVFEYFLQREKERGETLKDNDSYNFKVWVNDILYQNNKLYEARRADLASFKVAKEIDAQMFANPSDFVLVIEGGVDIYEVSPYISQFLSSISNKDSLKGGVDSLVYNDNLSFGSGDYTYFHKNPQPSIGLIYIPVEVTLNTTQRSVSKHLLSYIVRERLFTQLRGVQAQSYSQQSYFIKPSFHNNYDIFHVMFTARDEQIAMMHECTKDLFSKLFAFGVSDAEFEEAKAFYNVGVTFTRAAIDQLIHELSQSPMLRISKIMKKD